MTARSTPLGGLTLAVLALAFTYPTAHAQVPGARTAIVGGTVVDGNGGRP